MNNKQLIESLDCQVRKMSEAVNLDVKRQRIERDIKLAIKKYFKNDPESEDWTVVESRIKDDRIFIEVRAELNYEGMTDLADYLDKVVRKYDRDAYFDQEEPGIMIAVIE